MKQERNRIIFLGTGGGKNVMFTQIRKTGGIYIKMDDTRLIIDPGPGSLVHAQKLRLSPERLDGILLSHIHPDHSTDANALLDGMEKRLIVAEEHCIKPSKAYYPCISRYQQGRSKVHKAKAGSEFRIRNIRIKALRADHYAPTVGFRIEGTKTIGFTGDGTYYKGQGRNYENCDILILNVLVPKGKRAMLNKHMSVDGAIKLLTEIEKKPKLIIIQHFSFWMLRSGVLKQARAIADATGVKTVAAEDFMEVDLETLRVRKNS